MNKRDVMAIMMIIKTAYPNYYKNQSEISDAVNLWAEMLVDDESQLIAKTVKEFIKNDASGFPPTIGQIRWMAKDIHRKEWEQRKREQDLLPEPETERAEMPDEIREKLRKIIGGWKW